jgi:hypothetical protein
MEQDLFIFGGIDTKKYIGTLGEYPMIPWEVSPDKTPRHVIYLGDHNMNCSNLKLNMS